MTYVLRISTFFMLPLLALLILPGYVLIRSGEWISLDRIVELQAGPEPTLYGPGYFEPNPNYKVLAATERHAKILVLGSSRVQEFRAYFFSKRSADFYNAGGMSRRIEHFRALLERMDPATLPDTLIVGLDQWYFSSDWVAQDHEPLSPFDYQWTADHYFTYLVETFRKTYSDIYTHKVQGRHLGDAIGLNPNYKNIYGLQARVIGLGYRNDGSELIPTFLPGDGSVHRFDYGFERARANVGQFMWGNDSAASSMYELGLLLQFCVGHHIKVIGFLPPYEHLIYEAMKTDGHHAFLQKLPLETARLFGSYGQQMFDFTDMATAGGR